MKHTIFVTFLFFATLSSEAMADFKADQALIDAVQARDISAINAAVNKGAEINTRVAHKQGFTPLIAAFTKRGAAKEKSQVPIVKALIAQGADPNLVDSNGWSAFAWAVGASDVDSVRYMLKSGINKTNRSLALIAAVASPQIDKQTRDIYEMVIASEIDFDLRSKIGRSALHQAVISCNQEAVAKLLSKGVDVNAQEMTTGKTPLMYLAERNRVAGAFVECKPRIAILDLLKSKGALVEIKDKGGKTARDYAKKLADPMFFTLLIRENKKKVLFSKGATTRH